MLIGYWIGGLYVVYPGCGFEEPGRQTVEEWIRNQGLADYNEMNDLVLDLIRLKNLHRPEALDPASRRLLRLALYDIDGFREYAAHQKLTLPSPSAPDLETLEDTVLLRLSRQWVQRVFIN